MTQSTIPYKMWREYHPKLTDCIIRDAHLGIFDWFLGGKMAFFTLNPKNHAIFDISYPSD